MLLPFQSILRRSYASAFAPRRVLHPKSHKGHYPCPIGGSTKGTTLCFAPYGLRILQPARLTSAQLTSMQTTMKRALKSAAKGVSSSGSARNTGGQIWMRVFPDKPVTKKGNEVRMGKGKGAFEYWACWVGPNRVVFELGGMKEEVAREAVRLASTKLGVKTEFVVKEVPKCVDAAAVSI